MTKTRKSIIFLLTIFAALCFGGCDGSSWLEHDFIITNETNLTVTFSINGYGDTTYTLAPSESLKKSLYDNPNISFNGHPRVKFISGKKKGYIKDLVCHKFLITNTTFKDVLLTEKKSMLGETFGETIILPKAVVNFETDVIEYNSIYVNVYTSNPIFLANYEDSSDVNLNLLIIEQLD